MTQSRHETDPMENSGLNLSNSLHIVLNQLKEKIVYLFDDVKHRCMGQFIEAFWHWLSVRNANIFSEDFTVAYNKVKADFDLFMTEFSGESSRKSFKLSQDRRLIFLQIAHIHTLLMREKFLLADFNEEDNLFFYQSHVARLAAENERLNAMDTKCRAEGLATKTDELETWLTIISDDLKEKNILHLNVYFKKDPQFEQRYLHSKLISIPPVIKLNHIINRLDRAKAEIKTEVIAARKTELLMFARNIQHARVALEGMITEKMQQLQANFDYGAEYIAEIERTLMAIAKDKTLSRTLRKSTLVFEYQQLFQGLIQHFLQTLSRQETLETLSWRFSKKSLEAMLLETNQRLLDFSVAYLQQLSEQDLLRIKSSYAEKMETVDRYVYKSKAKMSSLNEVWIACVDSLVLAENILQSHVNDKTDSISEMMQSFLKRHWGKLTLGASGGLAAGTLPALLLMLHPVGFGLALLGGAVLGTTLSAGAGIGKDHHEVSKNKSVLPRREDVLQPLKKEPISKPPSFWTRSKEKFEGLAAHPSIYKR